jgi:starch synthase
VDPDAPLLGFIGRLDMQKGVDLICECYDWLIEQGAQVVLLGSGREDLENALRYGRCPYCMARARFPLPRARRQAGCEVGAHSRPWGVVPCGGGRLFVMVHPAAGAAQSAAPGGSR